MVAKAQGALVALPSDGGVGLAKVIFASSYFADVILIKLFRKRIAARRKATEADFDGPFDLYYTSASPVKSRRWQVVASQNVSGEELALTRRTSGGETWIEDRHIGPASAGDLAELPKMQVHGFKLVEKYAGRMDLID